MAKKIKIKKHIETELYNAKVVYLKSKYKAGFIKVIEEYNGDLTIELADERTVAKEFGTDELIKVMLEC